MGMPADRVQIPAKDTCTYEDYARLPEGAPYQLIGGKLVMTPSPSTGHQAVVLNLSLELAGFVRKTRAGPGLLCTC